MKLNGINLCRRSCVGKGYLPTKAINEDSVQIVGEQVSERKTGG